MNQRARPRWRRLIQEATAGVTQSASKSALPIIGTALGIGSFIAVLGATSSANGQISKDFDQLAATQVAVQAVERTGAGTAAIMPPDAEKSAERIEGVEAAGALWDITVEGVSAMPSYFGEAPVQFRVIAVSSGYWNVAEPTLVRGRTFDSALGDQPVAVVGQQAAEALHVLDVENLPTLFLDGRPVTVIGIISDTRVGSAALSGISIPTAFARTTFGDPGSRETLTIRTATGAGQIVAEQVALAIDPYHPESLKVAPPPSPSIVRDQVSGSVQTLFYALAAICIIVGAVGISNASLVGVIARTPEIGLRRSLGALPRHIAAQFLIESAIRGLLGGAIGSSLGLATVALVALSQQWTAIVQPWTVGVAPIAGAVVGMIAGLYPALRASRIEPVEAFRR